MPESAECRIFTDNLIKEFDGQSLQNIEIVGGRYLKQSISRFDGLEFPLTNIKFNCKGKFIYWKTNDENINLCFTLGMTGAFAPRAKHSAIKFQFEKSEIFFNDPRRFGTFRIFDQNELNEKLNSLGWDILQENIPYNFSNKIREQNRKTIAETMLNQKYFSGCGNYLRSECLYRAKIHPLRLISQLSNDEIILICQKLQEIVSEAYIQGGATIATFKDMYGNTGKFFDSFKVYSKKQDPDGKPIKKIKAPDGRSVFLVESIQKV